MTAGTWMSSASHTTLDLRSRISFERGPGIGVTMLMALPIAMPPGTKRRPQRPVRPLAASRGYTTPSAVSSRLRRPYRGQDRDAESLPGGLGVLLRADELHGRHRFVAHDPSIMPWLDLVGVARGKVDLRAVDRRHVKLSRHDVAHVVRLAGVRVHDGLDALGPPPPGFEAVPSEVEVADVDDLDLAPVELPRLVRRLEALSLCGHDSSFPKCPKATTVPSPPRIPGLRPAAVQKEAQDVLRLRRSPSPAADLGRRRDRGGPRGHPGRGGREPVRGVQRAGCGAGRTGHRDPARRARAARVLPAARGAVRRDGDP